MTNYVNQASQVSLNLPLLPKQYTWRITGNIVSEPWDLPGWFISLNQYEPQVGSFTEEISFVANTVNVVEVKWDQKKFVFPTEEDFIIAAHQALQQTPEVVELITLMLSGLYTQNNAL